MRFFRAFPHALSRARLAAAFTLAVVGVFGFAADALTGSAKSVRSVGIRQSCMPSADCSPPGQPDLKLAVPKGLSACPESGPGAACPPEAAAEQATAGRPVVPPGKARCAASQDKPLPPTPAACAADPAGQLPLSERRFDLLAPTAISLTADSTAVPAGAAVTLTAVAGRTVSDKRLAIEIFDQTSGLVVGACGENSRCEVGFVAAAGSHTFVAVITPPTTEMPAVGSEPSSNTVTVDWLGAGIKASTRFAPPGASVVVTVTSSEDVQTSGRRLEILDLTSNSTLTYCSSGKTCTTAITVAAGGAHDLVARVTGTPESVSASIRITWLDVKLVATTLNQVGSGVVYLHATVNQNLAATPWTLGIYDDQGHLLSQLCKTGTACTAVSWSDGVTPHAYRAVIGTSPDEGAAPRRMVARKAVASSALDPVAMSAEVAPSHLLWGVDSCKAFVGSYAGNLWASVARRLGTPDFWGRYLTNTVCPGISSVEVAFAHAKGMGILPIYNDYDCSAVVSRATGARYAAAAVAAAVRLGIPPGRALAIDIEPPGDACPGAGRVDAGFIEGWYAGVQGAGYLPVFYGNGTAGSAFASGWCRAVADVDGLASDSYVWSFEPSLTGRFGKARAPRFAPYAPHCAATIGAWQYMISTGGNPDVDQDLALSVLPLWYP